MNVDTLVDEIYGEMLKRCGIMEEEEEEETGQETYIGDLNVFDDKPEAYGKKAELKDRKKHEFLSSTTRQFE